MAPTAMAPLAALAALLLLAAPAFAKGGAGDYFTLCHRSDPKMGECVKNTIQQSRAQLAAGIPDLKMLPLDPLHVNEMELREGHGNFLFVLKMTNMTLRGLKNMVAEDVQFDLREGRFRMELLIPRIELNAQYEMNGRMLALPIQGKGECSFDFKGVKANADVKHLNTTKNGKVYAQVDTVKWNIDVEHALSHFTNLFNGDKTLGDSTNQFLNLHWKDAFETYRHLPEEAFGQVLRGIEGLFFEQFSLDELFPE